MWKRLFHSLTTVVSFRNRLPVMKAPWSLNVQTLFCPGLFWHDLLGSLVSHVPCHCFEVSFEAMQWSVIFLPHPSPSFCGVHLRFTAFSAPETRLNLNQCVCQLGSSWFSNLIGCASVVCRGIWGLWWWTCRCAVINRWYLQNHPQRHTGACLYSPQF